MRGRDASDADLAVCVHQARDWLLLLFVLPCQRHEGFVQTLLLFLYSLLLTRLRLLLLVQTLLFFFNVIALTGTRRLRSDAALDRSGQGRKAGAGCRNPSPPGESKMKALFIAFPKDACYGVKSVEAIRGGHGCFVFQ